jgi:competence protein ComEA
VAFALTLAMAGSCACGGAVERPTRPVSAPAPAPSDAVGPIDINAAGEAEISALPSFGPRLAARVVEHRRLHGPFERTEELMTVEGVSEARYLAVRFSLTVGR